MKAKILTWALALTPLINLAQSISINPSNLQLPRVASLPTCVAADYGEMVFATSNNKAHICTPTGWQAIEPSVGLSIPLNANQSRNGQGLLDFTNTSSVANSKGVYGAASAPSGGFGIHGVASATSPTNNTVGVYGQSQSVNTFGIGVYGRHSTSGVAVAGESNSGIGVEGVTTAGTGTGVKGSATTGDAIFGTATGTGKAGNFLALSNGIAGQFEAGGGTSARALYTIGAIRFSGIGEGAGKYLKSDANGVASWQAVTKDEVESYTATAFTTERTDHNYAFNGAAVYFTSLGGSLTSGQFILPIKIPNGATITSMMLYYLDNEAAGSINCVLQTAPQTGSYTTTETVLSASGNNSTFLAAFKAMNVVVDNDANFYRLVVTMGQSINLRLMGVKINYTYTVID
jgi:hypothetical protein